MLKALGLSKHFPSCYHLAKKENVRQSRLILSCRGRLGLLMSAGLGGLLGCAIQGDALIYSLSSGMADVVGYINWDEFLS
jgi:hypothetical protein